MKKCTILCFSVFLCLAFVLVTGCNKSEEPNRTATAVAVPGIASPPSSADKAALPSVQQPSAAPTPLKEKPGIQPTPPEGHVSVTPPETPGISVSSMPPAPAPQNVPAEPVKKDIILVAGFGSQQMHKGVPAGWALERTKGTPSIKLEKGSDIYCLHMASSGESSFGIKKKASVDIKEYPYLNWRWKATKLPHGGDIRNPQMDDQALQLYVAFNPTGFPAILNSPVLGYVWDNEAPKHWSGRSVRTGGNKIRNTVIRNNTDQLGKWYTEKRNIYEDYKHLFKNVKGCETPGMTYGVQFHINSQYTKSDAESYICEVYFSKK